MKLTKEKIIKIINKHIFFIKKNFDVKTLYLFGSYVRDEQTEKSDIDILVEFNHKYDFLNELDLQTYLYKVFKKNIGICEKNHIREIFRDEILSSGMTQIC